MQCANPSCNKPLEYVWKGFGLCRDCYCASLGIHDGVEGGSLIDILDRMEDAPTDLSSDEAIKWALADIAKDEDELADG